MDELKPCPHCEKDFFTIKNKKYEWDAYFVECDTCAARGPVEGSVEKAKESWNTRTPSTPDREMLLKFCIHLDKFTGDKLMREGLESLKSLKWGEVVDEFLATYKGGKND